MSGESTENGITRKFIVPWIVAYCRSPKTRVISTGRDGIIPPNAIPKISANGIICQ